MANKTVIITGGARRIGAAIARELHQREMDIVIHFNTARAAARALSKELNQIRKNSAWIIQADLGQTEVYPDLIESIMKFNGRLDVLINNASVFYPVHFGEATSNDWDTLMGVNLKAPFFLSQAAAPLLSQNKGCIINLADIYANNPLKHHGMYCISKAGVIMLTKSLALELAPDVRVNAISPGAICWHENITAQEQAMLLQKIPMQTQGTTEDIARAVGYLIENANYTTGQNLVIDGGRSLIM